jgi:uncharacterized protein YfiM (DUF2279 family)
MSGLSNARCGWPSRLAWSRPAAGWASISAGGAACHARGMPRSRRARSSLTHMVCAALGVAGEVGVEQRLLHGAGSGTCKAAGCRMVLTPRAAMLAGVRKAGGTRHEVSARSGEGQGARRAKGEGHLLPHGAPQRLGLRAAASRRFFSFHHHRLSLPALPRPRTAFARTSLHSFVSARRPHTPGQSGTRHCQHVCCWPVERQRRPVRALLVRRTAAQLRPCH